MSSAVVYKKLALEKLRGLSSSEFQDTSRLLEHSNERLDETSRPSDIRIKATVPIETVEDLKIDSDSESTPEAATFKVTQSSALHLKGFRS